MPTDKRQERVQRIRAFYQLTTRLLAERVTPMTAAAIERHGEDIAVILAMAAENKPDLAALIDGEPDAIALYAARGADRSRDALWGSQEPGNPS